MRVESAHQPHQVEAQRTPVGRADLRGAIARAHQKLTGHAATPALLDTLTAHASLETGSGDKMYNFNFGGIKGRSPSGDTAVCRTKEVENGKEIEIRDGFRAYRTLDEGALDYVRLMKERFGAALGKAEAGDLSGFAHALKQAHYYTADENAYASALHNLAGPGGATHVAAGSATKPAERASAYPDTLELGRVLDAIARHPTHLAASEEDDDA